MGHDNIKTCTSDQEQSYYAFYTEAYMRSLFPGAVILPPANREMQHCCIIEGDLRANGPAPRP